MKKTIIRYKVSLTKEERDQLKLILNKGKHTAFQFKNACILSNVDEGNYGEKLTNAQITQLLKMNPKTIERLKQLFGSLKVIQESPQIKNQVSPIGYKI